MADISADTLMPSGEFKASFCTGTLTIASGTSGTLLTANSTGGRKIRLTMLASAPSGSESGISVTADGSAVIAPLTLSSALLTAGTFSVGFGVNSSGQPLTGNIRHIEAFNTITVTKATGGTGSVVYYALEQGL